MRQRFFSPLRTEVTELALGTWGLSGDGYGPVAPAEADAVIDRALELGISLFDTADCYAGGEMERRLGRRLASHTEPTFIVTRLGTEPKAEAAARKNFDVPYLKEAFERSRDRLGRSPVDVCLLHNPAVSTLERGEATEFLKDLQQSGKLRAWGVSAGNRETALAAIDAGAQVLSIPYNIFYSRAFHAVAAEVAMRGVAVLAHSVLAYGLLTSHWSAERTFDPGDHRQQRWTRAGLRKRVEQLEVVRELVGGEVLTPRAAALRFVLSNQLISSAILGPRSTAQLEQLVREAGNGPPYLPEAQLSKLSSRLLSVGIVT